MSQTNEHIRRGRTEIYVPHKDGKITFVYEKHGPGTYSEVGDSITRAGLAKPTMAETASLAHLAHSVDEPEFNDIKQIMKDRWLWGFTGSYGVPKTGDGLERGVYFEDNTSTRDGMPYIDRSELVRKIQANDKSVRFIPFDYKIGEMTSLELARNPYLIGLAGKEGAEKLAEIADKYRSKPRLYALDSNIKQEEIRVGTLDAGWLVGARLFVCGRGRGSIGSGCAFGVQKAGEASEPKK